MKEERMNLREWILRYNSGEYNSKDRLTQIDAGWFDWFCRDTSLANKTYRFGRLLRRIKNNYILDNYYVYFKNCCPASNDPLFDRVGIASIDEDIEDRQYVIEIGDARNGVTYCLFDSKAGYEEAVVSSNKSKDVIDYFNNLGGDDNAK